MGVLSNTRSNIILFSFVGLLLLVNAAPPGNSQTYEYNLLKLKSFWKGVGSSVAYPGKILLTSDKLKEQRGFISSYEATELTDYFSMTINLNFHITNKESRQSLFFSLTQDSVSPGPFGPTFNILPLPEVFTGLMIYVKNFDTMHVGTFESKTFNENELLSRSKVCKISQKENGLLSFQIEYSVGKLSVLLLENQDGSFRPCAQFSSFKFSTPLYISTGAADDFGFSETVICKNFPFFNKSSLGSCDLETV